MQLNNLKFTNHWFGNLKLAKFNILVAIITVMQIISVIFLSPSYAETDETKREIMALDIQPINEWTSTYINNYMGYSINLYSGLEQDNTVFEKRARLFNKDFTIDFFYDNFHGTSDTYESYTYYSNANLLKNKAFFITDIYHKEIAGKNAKVMIYKRAPLKRIDNDKNYYAFVEIPLNSKEVISIFFKSTRPIENLNPILNTFKLFPKTKNFSDADNIKLRPTRPIQHEETLHFMSKYLGKKSKTNFGFFNPNSWGFLESFEQMLDYKFPVLLVYRSISDSFPDYDLERGKAEKRVIELTLQTTTIDETGYPDENFTFEILNGRYDYMLDIYAKKIKALDYPVLFRLNNEMNGDWCLYSAYHMGKDTDLYIELYRYVHSFFKKHNVENALFIFNPNERSFPNFAWNHEYCYYPGNKYVDIIGLTGYNTGNYYKGEIWREFEQIYDPLYKEYEAKYKHPFIVTEFASASKGGDKVGWINNMFAKLKNYPKVKLWIWWNGQDYDMPSKIPSRVYKLEENTDIIEAMKRGLSNLK